MVHLVGLEPTAPNWGTVFETAASTVPPQGHGGVDGNRTHYSRIASATRFPLEHATPY